MLLFLSAALASTPGHLGDVKARMERMLDELTADERSRLIEATESVGGGWVTNGSGSFKHYKFHVPGMAPDPDSDCAEMPEDCLEAKRTGELEKCAPCWTNPFIDPTCSKCEPCRPFKDCPANPAPAPGDDPANPAPAPGDDQRCCSAMTATCLSCKAGITKEEYCRLNPNVSGCSQQDSDEPTRAPTPPTSAPTTPTPTPAPTREGPSLFCASKDCGTPCHEGAVCDGEGSCIPGTVGELCVALNCFMKECGEPCYEDAVCNGAGSCKPGTENEICAAPGSPDKDSSSSQADSSSSEQDNRWMQFVPLPNMNTNANSQDPNQFFEQLLGALSKAGTARSTDDGPSLFCAGKNCGVACHEGAVCNGVGSCVPKEDHLCGTVKCFLKDCGLPHH